MSTLKQPTTPTTPHPPTLHSHTLARREQDSNVFAGEPVGRRPLALRRPSRVWGLGNDATAGGKDESGDKGECVLLA